MSVLTNLIQRLGRKASGRKTHTVVDVRDLIQARRLDEAAQAAGQLNPDTPNLELARTCLLGEIAFRQQRDEEAEALFRDALKDSPGLAEAHYGLSLVMLARGEVETALRHAQFAVNKIGMEARFQAQLGLCQLEHGNYGVAAKSLARATRLDAKDKSSWNNLGIAARAHGDLDWSRQAFQRALEIDPDFESARRNLELLEADAAAIGATPGGSAAAAEDADVPERLRGVRELATAGRLADAIDACEALCAADADDAAATIELYRLYREQGDVRSGLDALIAFRTRRPDDVEVLVALACALARERQYKAAKPLLEKALVLRPDDVELLLAMADTRGEQGRLAEAGELVERAFALDSSLHMKGRLAASHQARCNYETVLQLVDEMLAEDPRVSDAVAGMRVDALTHLGRHDEALPILDAVIERFPNEPERRFPRATIHLLNERFAEGWDDYAFRNLSSVKHLRMVAFPIWKGEPLQGKRILVLAEQGLGDQVMFASCLPDLLALGPSRVVVEAIDRIAPTLRRSFPGCEVVATQQDSGLEWVRDIGEMDYFMPAGDLPQRFRRSRDSFPAHRGYLVPAPERAAHWRQTLAALGPRPKIGVSWRGGTEVTRTTLRTMGAALVAELASAVDADWVALQYGPVAEDLAQAQAAGMPLHYWPEAIKDLDEFAALVSTLDLVVTVCNTTVHYAGALNVPVWVMAPRIPEWRYGLHFRSLPWYPSSVMYRQVKDRDWTDVMTSIRRDLSARFGPPAPRAGGDENFVTPQ